jgi:hypothetical protein
MTMSHVNLSRLWYIFPPDDQELGAGEFSSKVSSYVKPLPDEEKLAVLDFLIIQYAAFERQLDIMRAGAVLQASEHQRRAQALSQHLATLHRCRDRIQDASAPGT